MGKQSNIRIDVQYRSICELKLPAREIRKHSKKQIEQIAASMSQFGFLVPVLVSADGGVVVGAARLRAAQTLGLVEAPTILIDHLSAADQRAYAVADNKLAEASSWDVPNLKIELQELSVIDVEYDLEITGFEGSELDSLLAIIDPAADADDALPDVEAHPVCAQGDVWRLGNHRLVCGDARSAATYAALMAPGELARTVITDPPYNLPIDGFVATRGQSKRREFAMASGEMSKAEFEAFLAETLGLAADHATDGSIHYTFMDWRSMSLLQRVGEGIYSELKNVLVWVKDNAGLSPFYRSQHEFILVSKKGKAAHLNTFGLGGKGRYRTNVLTYPGASGFNAQRDEALAMHPTVKPVALVADLIRDVTRRGDIVLDPFAGSGTLVIAAQKTGRTARLIEIDPLYCDVICRRWKAFSGEDAILGATGEAFTRIAAKRATTTGGG